MREHIDVEGGYLDYDARTKLYHVYQAIGTTDVQYSYIGCTFERDEAVAMIKE